MNSGIYAVQHVRRLRGGSQSQLLRASDGGYYVTKPLNNPQHVRVLANEMFAANLGELLGLPIPRVDAIEVSEWLITNTPELRIDLGGCSTCWKPGLHAASRYVDDPGHAEIFDFLEEGLLKRVANVTDFSRVLVLDRWACNCDGRQAVFSRRDRRQPYSAAFIDQGYCFNAGDWSFPDCGLRGVYAKNCVYEHVRGWESFEPALTHAEQIDPSVLWRIAAAIPAEWYEGDTEGLHRLVETLYKRRAQIRELITQFRTSSRNPFPNWSSNTC